MRGDGGRAVSCVCDSDLYFLSLWVLDFPVFIDSYNLALC